MPYISFCGIHCSDCPIYMVTQSGDRDKAVKLAAEYSGENHQFTADDMVCHGCFSDSAKISKMCGACDIRLCAETKNGLTSCAECDDYPCENIEKYVPVGTPSRANLDWQRLQSGKPVEREVE